MKALYDPSFSSPLVSVFVPFFHFYFLFFPIFSAFSVASFIFVHYSFVFFLIFGVLFFCFFVMHKTIEQRYYIVRHNILVVCFPTTSSCLFGTSKWVSGSGTKLECNGKEKKRKKGQKERKIRRKRKNEKIMIRNKTEKQEKEKNVLDVRFFHNRYKRNRLVRFSFAICALLVRKIF